MNLSYGNFVIPLINAVKEQQKMILDLKAENTKLKSLVTGLCEKFGDDKI